ncbi:MAG: hypothetical protein J0H68_03135 [Sphingobacteriia bacterium]|nr:hypothetical protein [Sphingobacteriia bacterium]
MSLKDLEEANSSLMEELVELIKAQNNYPKLLEEYREIIKDPTFVSKQNELEPKSDSYWFQINYKDKIVTFELKPSLIPVINSPSINESDNEYLL